MGSQCKLHACADTFRFTKPQYKAGPFDLAIGNDVTYSQDPAGVLNVEKMPYMDDCVLSYNTKSVPLLLYFKCKTQFFALHVMAGLLKRGLEYIPIVTKQRIEMNNMGFLVHNAYGINAMCKAENGEENDEGLCSICFDAIPNILIRPCSHVCVCSTCIGHVASKSTARCPLCRVLIDELIKLNS
ncbi:bifunctional E3 ubiquitin-protein ligase MGRN1-RNF157-like/Zinc finger [Babesia duncani]|uniref:Bifunctional E3 ubiquitin-protein ligase MGRN1-RNF157-like/Zinc finger n=1 Tax=Babesia duncani TaxID=323732 RepID=A0AAD9PMM3_9APIC|nr:bifunctional E3 ubiquitin-protein ligase MGRN1-RNF157-like/Zinc finger [Babesia duncani]